MTTTTTTTARLNGAWGTRAQIGAARRDLEDLRGNSDGIWGNEQELAGTPAAWFERQPVGAKLAALAAAGVTTGGAVRELAAYLASAEKTWGAPVMDALVKGRLRDGDVFAVNKAMTLEALGREPPSVVDGFVRAAGTVDGRAVAERDLFFQLWKPTAAASGHVVVAMPGFGETSQDYTTWAAEQNAKGHAVIVVDEQWAGHTLGGKPGQVDSGFGVARDAAVMAAFAEETRVALYGDKPGKIAMFGQSMGGGLGVLGAAVFDANDRIQLVGRAVPKNVVWVAQAPFLGPTPSATNNALLGASKLPFVNRVALAPIGVPDFTDDPRAESIVSQNAVRGDVRVTFSAFRTVAEGAERILELYDNGKLPHGTVAIVHAERDTLANPANSKRVADRLGITPLWVPGHNHALTQSEAERRFGRDVIDTLL